MKIGMNLLLWTSHVTEEHRPVLEMLKKQGYDASRFRCSSSMWLTMPRSASGAMNSGWRARQSPAAAWTTIRSGPTLRCVPRGLQTTSSCSIAAKPRAAPCSPVRITRPSAIYRLGSHGRRVQMGRRQHAASRRTRREDERDARRRVSQSLRVLFPQLCYRHSQISSTRSDTRAAE